MHSAGNYEMLLALQRFPDPRLMLHTTIPQPLWGCAPRTFLGDRWWDEVRGLAYKKYGYRCWCCGVSAQNALFKQSLEAHENYDVDLTNAVLIFVGTVALCHVCHAGIHFGLTSRKYADGQISRIELETVIENRAKLLHRAHEIGGNPYWRPAVIDQSKPDNRRWRMKIGDRFFSPEDLPAPLRFKGVRRSRPLRKKTTRNRKLRRRLPSAVSRTRAPRRTRKRS